MNNVLSGVDAENAFIQWYEANHPMHEQLTNLDQVIANLEREIKNREDLVASTQKSWKFLSRRRRRRIGRVQQELVPLRAKFKRKLSEREEWRNRRVSAHARELYRASCAVPRVRAIHVLPTAMSWIIETDALFSQSAQHGGRWHRIGAFSITINLEQPLPATIHWSNHEGSRNDYIAPQIAKSGNVGCFGPVLGALKNAFAEKKYDVAVAMLVRFTECAAHDKQLELWPAAEPHEVPEWYRETQFFW